MEAKERKVKKLMQWAMENVDKETVTEENKKSDEVDLKNEQSYLEDAKLEIQISKDKMSASIVIIPPSGGKMMNVEEIIEELALKGIVYGIDKAKIREMIDRELFYTPIEVAKGREPVNGKNGQIIYQFETKKDLKPRVDEDGRVDFHNLDLIINVKKGQLIAEIVPPTRGVSGITVTNRTLPARDGKEARIIEGKNVVISEDKLKVFADIDGHPVLKDGKISVLPVLEVKGDVGLATGNINFLGSVIVQGNVKSGFVIEADGDVEINGSVEDAKIMASGNIILKRGIQGRGIGILKAGEDVVARYIENTNVEADQNIIIYEAAMHSCLSAGKIIKINGKKGLIVGGTAKAGEELSAKIIGSPMSTYTEIEVGIDPSQKRSCQEIMDSLRKMDEDLLKINQAIEILERLDKRNLLTPDKKILFQKLINSKEKLLEEQVLQIKEKEKMDFITKNAARAKVSASNVAYSGVNIIIGNASLKLRDKISHATFYNYEGQIRFGSYEG